MLSIWDISRILRRFQNEHECIGGLYFYYNVYIMRLFAERQWPKGDSFTWEPRLVPKHFPIHRRHGFWREKKVIYVYTCNDPTLVSFLLAQNPPLVNTNGGPRQFFGLRERLGLSVKGVGRRRKVSTLIDRVIIQRTLGSSRVDPLIGLINSQRLADSLTHPSFSSQVPFYTPTLLIRNCFFFSGKKLKTKNLLEGFLLSQISSGGWVRSQKKYGILSEVFHQ